ncbi:MAG: carboxypeptidase-like regulatory domain-containing protein, partial [Mariniphaga sp.]
MKIICLTGFLTRKTKKKWGRIMRLTWFLIVGILLSANASSYSQSTRLDIKMNDGSVMDLMKLVEKNSEYVFLYKNEDLDLMKKINVELRDATIQQILDAGFEGQDVVWDVYDRQIIIHKAKKTDSQELVVQQDKMITGIVTDQSGQPLPGVTIVVKGTTTGIVSDSDGRFSFKIPDNAEILQFSFVGMQLLEVPVQGRTTFAVVMSEETIDVEEVVVTALGIQKNKRTLTYATQQVGMDAVTTVKDISLGNALAGKLAGVYVSTGSGAA